MARCEQCESPNNFNIWISSDSQPYFKYTGGKTWFYFGVKGVDRNRTLYFHLRNLNHQRGLYAAGLRPFYRFGNDGKFKRTSGKITWNNGPDGFQLNFEHTF